jgi:hypothetical protein
MNCVLRPVKCDYPSPLARLIAEIKRDRPDVYDELRRRHVEPEFVVDRRVDVLMIDRPCVHEPHERELGSRQTGRRLRRAVRG